MLLPSGVIAGGGLFTPDVILRVVNRSGATMDIGDCVQLDEGPTAPQTESLSTGAGINYGGTGYDGSSMYSNVVIPDTAGIQAGTLGVVVEAPILDNGTGRICVYGLVEYAFVIAPSGSIVVGDLLVATTAKNLSLFRSPNQRIIARARNAVTTPTTRILAKVRFNGVTGFGMQVT